MDDIEKKIRQEVREEFKKRFCQWTDAEEEVEIQDRLNKELEKKTK
jgi:hypothetical protein